MSWQWRMIQNCNMDWLVVSKLTWGWHILTQVKISLTNLKICTLMGSFWSKYIMFDLKNYRGVIFDGTEGWCKIWRKTDSCFEIICKIFVYRLKNSIFILESKMAELNQNKNSKQPDQPDPVWKLYFTLEING